MDELSFTGEIHNEILTGFLAAQVHTRYIGFVEGLVNVHLHHVIVHPSEALNQLIFKLFFSEFFRLGQSSRNQRDIGVDFRVVEVEHGLSFSHFDKCDPDLFKIFDRLL